MTIWALSHTPTVREGRAACPSGQGPSATGGDAAAGLLPATRSGAPFGRWICTRARGQTLREPPLSIEGPGVSYSNSWVVCFRN